MSIPRLVEAHPVRDYFVWIRFSDGTEGEVDLSQDLWGEVFESLKDPVKFRELSVHPELETLVWPCGADFAPEFLYKKLRPNQSFNADAQKTRAG